MPLSSAHHDGWVGSRAGSVVQLEWHLKHSSYSYVMALEEPIRTSWYAGFAPPTEFVTATPLPPATSPGAVQPVVDCWGRVAVALWGWWQSAHTAWRLAWPPNSSFSSSTWR